MGMYSFERYVLRRSWARRRLVVRLDLINAAVWASEGARGRDDDDDD